MLSESSWCSLSDLAALGHLPYPKSRGRTKLNITVTVPYQILTGRKQQLPELDGYSIDPSTLRRWACDAGVLRIITDGYSYTLDVGRRTVPEPELGILRDSAGFMSQTANRS